jgi:hypothetical protein
MGALDEGRYQDAMSMCKEAYRIHHRRDDLLRVAATLGRFARVLASTERSAMAATVLSTSDVVREEIGASPPWLVGMNDETRATIRSRLDEAGFAEAWEQGRKLTTDEAVALALDSLAAANAPNGPRSAGV